jgi:hypothetical protein
MLLYRLFESLYISAMRSEIGPSVRRESLVKWTDKPSLPRPIHNREIDLSIRPEDGGQGFEQEFRNQSDRVSCSDLSRSFVMNPIKSEISLAAR